MKATQAPEQNVLGISVSPKRQTDRKTHTRSYSQGTSTIGPRFEDGGLSFKLSSQLILERRKEEKKKNLDPWMCGLLCGCLVAFTWYCSFHDSSPETCHLQAAAESLTPVSLLSASSGCPAPPPSPLVQEYIKSWSAVAGRRKKAQKA